MNGLASCEASWRGTNLLEMVWVKEMRLHGLWHESLSYARLGASAEHEMLMRSLASSYTDKDRPKAYMMKLRNVWPGRIANRPGLVGGTRSSNPGAIAACQLTCHVISVVAGVSQWVDVQCNVSRSIGERPKHWPTTVFGAVGLLNIASVNSYVIWIASNVDEQKLRRVFVKELGVSLVKPHVEERMKSTNFSRDLKSMIDQVLGTIGTTVECQSVIPTTRWAGVLPGGRQLRYVSALIYVVGGVVIADLVLLTTDMPTLFGVATGLAIFTALICFVLKLFSRARYSRPRHYANANLAPPILFSSETGQSSISPPLLFGCEKFLMCSV
ncbi:hypothetical protein PR048_010912 [Dryococelus australis]|uniref:Uncharacterized protein n=1 Tax=Dryococelus australis TaxID=614101 RepID=A0ABQ9I4W2_9NEOP|nr:hypothetical protein PR048_010912 [Dryococelus australis]